MSAVDEITQIIGKTLLDAARDQSDRWDYVGYTFSSKNGVNFEASGFLFFDEQLQEFTVRKIGKELGKQHLRLREIMRIEGDAHWIASRSVLRHTDLSFKMHVEFDDINRWKITPLNADRAFDVLVDDAFV